MRGTKPEFWTDEKVVSVSRDARLLFIGMWNFMCDNGHIDDSPIQLKMRVFPADNIDVPPLVDELIEIGLLVRENGYLKAVNLSVHQSIDKRYLSLCDHCAHDGNPTFTEADRLLKPQVGKKNPAGARSAHGGHTAGTRSAPATEGEGEGEGEGEKKEEANASSGPRKRGTRLPAGWAPTLAHRTFATDHGIDPDREAEKFRNHWLAAAGRNAVKLDWDATWRNWIIRAAEEYSRRPKAVSGRDYSPYRDY